MEATCMLKVNERLSKSLTGFDGMQKIFKEKKTVILCK